METELEKEMLDHFERQVSDLPPAPGTRAEARERGVAPKTAAGQVHRRKLALGPSKGRGTGAGKWGLAAMADTTPGAQYQRQQFRSSPRKETHDVRRPASHG